MNFFGAILLIFLLIFAAIFASGFLISNTQTMISEIDKLELRIEELNHQLQVERQAREQASREIQRLQSLLNEADKAKMEKDVLNEMLIARLEQAEEGERAKDALLAMALQGNRNLQERLAGAQQACAGLEPVGEAGPGFTFLGAGSFPSPEGVLPGLLGILPVGTLPAGILPAGSLPAAVLASTVLLGLVSAAGLGALSRLRRQKRAGRPVGTNGTDKTRADEVVWVCMTRAQASEYNRRLRRSR